MAKTKAPSRGNKANPYKQQRVTPVEPKPKKVEIIPVAPFEAGEELHTIFNPLFYTITRPIIALSVQQSKFAVSGWTVTVVTSQGPTEIGSWHFFRKNPGHEPTT